MILCTDLPRRLVYNLAVLRIAAIGLLLLATLLGWPCWAQIAQGPAPENTPKATDPALVTCGEHPPLASRTARSDTLVSPDGKHRAYAEVEATALHAQRPSGYTGPLCVNTSRLFLAGDKDDFKIRFLQEPEDVETGNSVRLLDWSSDSRRLLVELAGWQYEQPGATHNVLLYDTRNGTFQQPDLARSLAKAYGHECSLDFRVLGFSVKGTIVLEAHPLSPEEEEILGVSSCTKKRGYFEMDRATEALVSIPDLPQIQHNAHSEPTK